MVLIVKPYITEKAAALTKQTKYIFIVHKKANKIEIKKAIERQYNVTITNVNTSRHYPEKTVRYTKKHVNKGQKPLYKKAIITLKKGETINLQSQTV